MRLLKQALVFGIIGIFICLFSLFSFADGFKRHGNVIEVEVGKVFVIALDSIRSTGFQWQLAKPVDKDKIAFLFSKYKKISDDRVGGLGEDELVFKAVGAGKTVVYLQYARLSEKDKAPAKKRRFVIVIKSPIY
jgi:predicted secreted protein